MKMKMTKTKVLVSVVINGETIETSCLAENGVAKNGKKFLFLADGQLKAAQKRLQAGERDIPDYSKPAGFGHWDSCLGGMVCYKA